jgi:2-polyprenyl-3-methyl-5-hydroxy-6-metoxy-1,4-benzoquinol methylase
MSFIEGNNMKTIDITGLVFNPIIWEWSLNKNKTKINYFFTAEKI